MVNQSTAEIIEAQLRSGIPPGELVKNGFPNSTVYRIKNRIEGKPSSGSGRRRSPKNREAPSQQQSTSSSTKVRLTQEEITLPGEMFILYEMVKTNFPQYEATKSQWLQQVVKTWAIEHAQELRFDFMFPQLFPGDDEDPEDEGGDDGHEGLDALEPFADRESHNEFHWIGD